MSKGFFVVSVNSERLWSINNSENPIEYQVGEWGKTQPNATICLTKQDALYKATHHGAPCNFNNIRAIFPCEYVQGNKAYWTMTQWSDDVFANSIKLYRDGSEEFILFCFFCNMAIESQETVYKIVHKNRSIHYCHKEKCYSNQIKFDREVGKIIAEEMAGRFLKKISEKIIE